ncbi:MAG TPA: ABC transporter permease, partial [Microthrixaceae bacterium]|nr:ABC transporter permease [Microthrixaceae bacterium]
MRAALAIAWADTRRVARDRAALFFVVLMPLLIILVVGMAFPADGELSVGVVDEDGTAASARIVDALAASAGLDVRSVRDASELDRVIRLQDLDGGIVIPAGYAESLAGDTTSTMRITTLPTSPAALTLMVAIEGVVTDQTTRDEVVSGLVARGSDRTEAAAAVDAAVTDWAGVGVRTEIQGGPSADTVNAFSFVAPGQLTLFLFASALAAGAALVEVRRLGILSRIRATPTSRRSLLGGVVGGRLA